MKNVAPLIAIAGGLLGLADSAIMALFLVGNEPPLAGGSPTAYGTILGYGGILVSFLILVVAGVAISHPYRAGTLMIIASVVGAVIGSLLLPILGTVLSGAFIAAMALTMSCGAVLCVRSKKAS